MMTETQPIYKPSQKKDFGLNSRLRENSTGGIYLIFRGFNFPENADVRSKNCFEIANRKTKMNREYSNKPNEDG